MSPIMINQLLGTRRECIRGRRDCAVAGFKIPGDYARPSGREKPIELDPHRFILRSRSRWFFTDIASLKRID